MGRINQGRRTNQRVGRKKRALGSIPVIILLISKLVVINLLKMIMFRASRCLGWGLRTARLKAIE